jgi:hypothetical protein
MPQESAASAAAVRQKRSDGLYPCVQFDSKGACSFGDKCKFSHLGKEDPGLADGATVEKHRRKRNGVCLQYAESGECQFGEKCRYRHEEGSGKAAADALLIATALGAWQSVVGLVVVVLFVRHIT